MKHNIIMSRTVSIHSVRGLIISVFLILFIILCIIFIPSGSFSAVAGEDMITQYPVTLTGQESTAGDLSGYTTYVVQPGDTLWEIADTRLNERYSTHMDYIDEVMRANGLTGSYIYGGELIIIPCDN